MRDVPILFQRIESLIIAAGVVTLYLRLEFPWYWLFVLFLIFDIFAVGYVVNKLWGAVTYNIGHSYIIPVMMGIYAITQEHRTFAFTSLVWLFHIAVDRTLGYGLKYAQGFTNTHLGRIGKIKQ